MGMFIKNDMIGIDSDIVAKCNSIDTLEEWEFKIYETIESVKMQISNEKNNDTILDTRTARPVGLQKKINFLKLQEVLRNQVKFRIAILNKVSEPIRMQKERDFWKEKFRYYLPNRYSDAMEELEDKFNN